ncbi:MAG: caspase family protein [Pirellulaceae bacterium]
MKRWLSVVVLSIVAVITACQGDRSAPSVSKDEGGPTSNAADAGKRGLTLLEDSEHSETGDGAEFYSDSWAVVIGIDGYAKPNSDLSRLEFAVNDAREFRDLLQEEFGYERDHVLYLADEQATREAIQRVFTEWLPKKVRRPTDSVLVFFAGHGLIQPTSNDGFIAAVDSRGSELHESCIGVDWVRGRLAKLPCRHRVMILDSCYSGSIFAGNEPNPGAASLPMAGGLDARKDRGPADGEQTAGTRATTSSGGTTSAYGNFAYYLRNPAFLAISAGRLTPVADGLGEQRHSIFTAELLRVLRERADSPRPDHAFTFRQVAAQVELRVANALGSRQIPDWGRLGEGDGDFVFRPTVRRTTPSELSEERRLTAHRRLIDVHLTNGLKPYAEGDLLAAAPHFLEALLLDQDDVERAQMHRVRLGTALRLSPRLVQAWFHEGAINDVQFSQDGRYVATAGDDFAARVWNANSGEAVTSTLMHRDSVLKVSFSPDGSRLATACGDTTGRNGKGAARIWNSQTGEPLTPWLEHEGMERPIERQGPSDYVVSKAGIVMDVRFSPDGSLLVTAADSGTVRIWDAETGELRHGPFLHPDGVAAAELAPDGRSLLTSTFSATQLWRIDEAGEPVLGPWQHDALYAAASLGAAGRRVAAIGEGKAAVYDATTGEAIEPSIEDGNRVVQAEFAPLGNRLVIASDDGSARVWDLRESRWVSPRLHAPGVPERRHGKLVRRFVGFRPDGRVVFTACGDVRLWDSRSGEAVCPPIPGGGGIVAFSPAGPYVVTVEGNRAMLWELPLVEPLRLTDGQARHWRDAKLSRYGRYVLARNDRFDRVKRILQGEVLVWNVESGRVIGPPLSHDGPITFADFSADEELIVTAVGDEGQGEARVWRTASGEPVTPALVHPAKVVQVALSRSGEWLATSCDDECVRLWSVGDGELVGKVELPHAPRFVAFDAAGERLITACGSEHPSAGEARVWAVPSLSPLTAPMTHTGYVISEVIHDGAGRLVTLSDRRENFSFHYAEAQLWDLATGERLTEPLRRGEETRFTADGEFVLIGGRVLKSADGSEVALPVAGEAAAFSAGEHRVVVFDRLNESVSLCSFTDDGAPVVRMKHDGEPLQAVFSGDGRLVATSWRKSLPNSMTTGAFRVWDAASGRPLTPAMTAGFDSQGWNAAAFDEYSRRLVVVSAQRVWTFDLAADNQPLEELELQVQAYSGRRLDASDDVLVDFPEVWQRLERTSAATNDAAREAHRLMWHRQQADAALQSGHEEDLFAAVSHLDRLDGGGGLEIDDLQRRANANRRFGRWQEAARDYTALIEQGILNHSVWAGRAEAQAGLRNWPAALDDCARAEAVGAATRELQLVRATAYAEQGRPELAQTILANLDANHDLYAFRDAIYEHAQRAEWAMVVLLAERMDSPLVVTDYQPYLEAAHDRLLELADSGETDHAIIRRVSLACEKLGDAQREAGKLDESLELYREAVDRYDTWREHAPPEFLDPYTEWKLLDKLGDTEVDLKQAGEALATFGRALRWVDEWIERDAEDQRAESCRWACLVRLASAALRADLPDEARRHQEQALKLAQRRFEADQQNESRRGDVFISWYNLANMQEAGGELDAADESFRCALDCITPIATRQSEHAMTTSAMNAFRDVADTWRRLGDVALERQRRPDAREYWRKSLDNRKVISDVYIGFRDDQLATLKLCRRAADIERSDAAVREVLFWDENSLEILKRLRAAAEERRETDADIEAELESVERRIATCKAVVRATEDPSYAESLPPQDARIVFGIQAVMYAAEGKPKESLAALKRMKESVTEENVESAIGLARSACRCLAKWSDPPSAEQSAEFNNAVASCRQFAGDALRTAIDRDLDDKQLLSDPDFQPLHKDPAWAELTRRLKTPD